MVIISLIIGGRVCGIKKEPECFTVGKSVCNKNDNIHKNEVQEIRLSDEYWQKFDSLQIHITEFYIIFLN